MLMKLIIREALEKDYVEINNLAAEVHQLHIKNRPDRYWENAL